MGKYLSKEIVARRRQEREESLSCILSRGVTEQEV